MFERMNTAFDEEQRTYVSYDYAVARLQDAAEVFKLEFALMDPDRRAYEKSTYELADRLRFGEDGVCRIQSDNDAEGAPDGEPDHLILVDIPQMSLYESMLRQNRIVT